MTLFVTGTSLADRGASLRDGIVWNITKVFVIGGVMVSIPGTLLGAMVPAEGMTRTDTIIENLADDHGRVWNWAGQGAEAFGQWLEEKG